MIEETNLIGGAVFMSAEETVFANERILCTKHYRDSVGIN